MCEEHLHLFSELRGNLVLGRFGDGAREFPCIFVFFTGDFAAVGLGAAFGFRWARLTDVFESLILGDTLAGWAAIGV